MKVLKKDGTPTKKARFLVNALIDFASLSREFGKTTFIVSARDKAEANDFLDLFYAFGLRPKSEPDTGERWRYRVSVADAMRKLPRLS